MQVCISTFTQTFIPTVEHLYISDYHACRPNSQWLDLLRLFTCVKNLYLSRQMARRIPPALQDPVGERETEVLPALQSLYLEELDPSERVKEAIGKFVDARQLSNRPIAVFKWDREQDESDSESSESSEIDD